MKTLQITLTLIDERHARLTAKQDQSPLISERSIALDDIQTLIKKSKTDFYMAEPNPVEVGKQLYFWLDGDDRWLGQALDQTREGLVLAIETAERLSHLPWETLHDRTEFLVMRSNPVVIVRQGEGVAKLRDLPERSLQVMFMATDPEAPGETKLNFEREEAEILDATRELPMVLRVEESGSIEGLKDIWQRYDGTMDVLHLSGHANIREVKQENGTIEYLPYFVTETQTGARDEATADKIAQVLKFREPRLVFLSGCRTGEAGGQGAVPSLAEQLIKQGVPAVLGWGRSVGDRVATVAAAVLYEKLATGYILAQALAFTYQTIAQDQTMTVKERNQWQLLRLYTVRSSEVWGAFVLPSGDRVVAPRVQFEDLFLDAEEQVRVASAAEFVGRRRNLQRCLRALRSQPGVVLHGLGGVGKSTVAKRLLERLVEYAPIVIYRELTEDRLMNALLRQCESERGCEILNGKLGLAQKLSKFFKQRSSEKEPPFVIVLDDFEANLEDRGDGLQVMRSAVVPVLQGVLEGINLSGVPHRVIVTSRYDFGTGMRDRLHREPLAGLRDGELQKKCDRLTAFQSKEVDSELQKKAIEIADGNPRLLEWLDLILLDGETDQIKILAAMEGKEAEFRAQILADELLKQQPEALVEMLGRGMVFEIPVPRSVFESVCEAEGRSVERAIALGLLEVVPDGSVRVPRILMVQGLEVDALAGAAARELYRVWWQGEKGATGDQAIEIHRLALIGREGAIAAEIADRVADRWINKSRFREAGQLCRSTLEVTEDFRVRHQLAKTEEPLGETNSALQNYQKALEDYPDTDDKAVLREKAAIIHNLANIYYANQRQVNQAINLYQQSLQLNEQIGNVQGKATTLHNLASIYATQGQVNQAINLYQQSLQLNEQIGNVQGKATTLHQMAGIYATQGQVNQAINLYQQSLQLNEQIGNVQGKATTLNNLASIYATQGQVNQAIKLFNQSLVLKEQIGYVQGKAMTLWCLGGLAHRQGEDASAIPYLQEAAAILQQIGSPDAAKAIDLLNRVIVQMLQSPEGQQRLQEIFNPELVQQWIQALNEEAQD
ncbi:tetratricopeptide repeat protein [Leptolyngbya sp. FACHB-17]|uniref:tetratricopeptide repeat protein n=1 Tax=unclassified Leptolyngbya TaxID=2650499 RepID=UPI001680913C|nr:tetratricopeptide repeat protein [Leptolyngbya sp. FACHB-17]MBD2079796.1 tetratricopeptide repeat protein [Leptolyngbya sp. FACHB-17]